MFFFAGQLEKSRTTPLKGKFAVAYSHFYPKDWDSCTAARHYFWTITPSCSMPRAHTHAACHGLLAARADRMLIGACDPMSFPSPKTPIHSSFMTPTGATIDCNYCGRKCDSPVRAS